MDIKLLNSIQLIIKRGIVSPCFWNSAPALFWALVVCLVARVALRWDHNVTVAPKANATPACTDDDAKVVKRRWWLCSMHKNVVVDTHHPLYPEIDCQFCVFYTFGRRRIGREITFDVSTKIRDPCIPTKSTFLGTYVDKLEIKEGGVPGVSAALWFPAHLRQKLGKKYYLRWR